MHFLQPRHRAIALPEASRMARLVAGVNNLLFRDWIPFVICLITLMGMADSNNRALQIAGLTTALGYIATLLLMVPRNLYAQSGKLVLVNRNIYARWAELLQQKGMDYRPETSRYLLNADIELLRQLGEMQRRARTVFTEAVAGSEQSGLLVRRASAHWNRMLNEAVARQS